LLGIVGTKQAPPEQVPEAQTVPQVPQLFGSVSGSVQPAPQAVCPAAQEVLHWLLEQTNPLEQTFPQAPQLSGSLTSAEHPDEHATVPAGQPVPPPVVVPGSEAPPQPAARETNRVPRKEVTKERMKGS